MELGFVEKVDPEKLTSPFFPSKVGGKPAWLDLTRVPSVATLSCSKCGKPLISLLQIQSSPDSSSDDEYHRTLFLFFCTDSKCHLSGDTSCCFVALRCEMTRDPYDNHHNAESHNTSGSAEASVVLTDTSEPREPPSLPTKKNSDNDGSSSELESSTMTTLCVVCGGRGPKHCGSCKCVHYCSRNHQLHDWKAGHKQVCPELKQGQRLVETLDYNPSLGVVLPELEIVTELEPILCLGEGKERSEEERMRDYRKFVGKETRGKLEEVGQMKELEMAATAGEKKDKLFRIFKKRISVEPTQVLRYQRGGQPLYVSGERIPKTEDIPKCRCGAERVFELQVMPQLLYYLKLDQHFVNGSDIDWGTLLLYTCSSASCLLGPGYHQEFIWKQDIS